MAINKELKKRLGKCYQLAGTYIMNNKKSVLVHGRLTSPYDGKVLEHAWVEYSDTVRDLVLDKIYGKDEYYTFFRAAVKHKYLYKEALRIMLKTKNFGPWD